VARVAASSVVAHVDGDNTDTQVSEPAPAASGATEETQSADEQSTPTSTWGWGSPETDNVYQPCEIRELSRDDFLAFVGPQRGGSTRTVPQGASAVFGESRSTLSAAVPPPIDTTTVVEGGKTYHKLKPTHAEMAPIDSAVTKAGEFVEGSSVFVDQNAACPSKKYPIRWRITDNSGLKAGEKEHCDDYRRAFDLTLGLYASGINNVAAAERRYSSRNEAIADAEQFIGVPSSQMMSRYVRLASRTLIRDTSGWHTPLTRDQKPSDNSCTEFTRTITPSSLPEVGKHSSDDVIK
jgi:hypothetical protein